MTWWGAMWRHVTWRGAKWQDVTWCVMGYPSFGQGERFRRTGFRRIGTSSITLGEPGPGRGIFFWYGFGNKGKSSHNRAWRTLDRAGWTFFVAGFGHIKQISIDSGGTSPGGTFSGLESDTLSKSVLTAGGPGPDRGHLLFRKPVI